VSGDHDSNEWPTSLCLSFRIEENLSWEHPKLITYRNSPHGLWRVIGENKWETSGYENKVYPKLPADVPSQEFFRTLNLMRTSPPTQATANLLHSYFWQLEVAPSYEDPNWCGGWFKKALPEWHQSLMTLIERSRNTQVQEVMDA
jgi:hypothetical protein